MSRQSWMIRHKNCSILGVSTMEQTHIAKQENAGIQMGMGVVAVVTVLLLITILFSVFSKGTEETT